MNLATISWQPKDGLPQEVAAFADWLWTEKAYDEWSICNMLRHPSLYLDEWDEFEKRPVRVPIGAQDAMDAAFEAGIAEGITRAAGEVS